MNWNLRKRNGTSVGFCLGFWDFVVVSFFVHFSRAKINRHKPTQMRFQFHFLFTSDYISEQLNHIELCISFCFIQRNHNLISKLIVLIVIFFLLSLIVLEMLLFCKSRSLVERLIFHASLIYIYAVYTFIGRKLLNKGSIKRSYIKTTTTTCIRFSYCYCICHTFQPHQNDCKKCDSKNTYLRLCTHAHSILSRYNVYNTNKSNQFK